MKAIRALMLVLALSVCAYADGEKTGVMPNDRTGVMPNEKTTPVDPVTEIALQVLQSVLPLF
jgi:hypothetical protein